MPKNSVSRRLARVEREIAADKPEVKTLDVQLNPLTAAGEQVIYAQGIWNGVAYSTYDLTRGFLQGLENQSGNIDGNYCKLTSMDMRILLENNTGLHPTSQVRLMIVRSPAAQTLAPADVQGQVLEYGNYLTHGPLVNVSPLKRNSTINGGYDVMYDRVHTLNLSTDNPNKSTKYIHFRKKWKKGLELRFSGGGLATALTLEQNRIVLFAMDASNPGVGAVPPAAGVSISFINRLRYSDE